jgi:hypothetical protein
MNNNFYYPNNRNQRRQDPNPVQEPAHQVPNNAHAARIDNRTYHEMAYTVDEGDILFLQKQGKKTQVWKDTSKLNPHNLAEQSRKVSENAVLRYIPITKRVFEPACSTRTINKAFNNWHYNRPIIDGFSPDIFKNQQLYDNQDIPVENKCECNLAEKLCVHADNADYIFSVDTIFYIFKAIIKDMLENPARIHFHILHLYDETKNIIGNANQEGEFQVYELQGQKMIWNQMLGNPKAYNHFIPATLNRPHYKHCEGQYINFHPIETANVGGSLYGLYQLKIETTPLEYIFDQINIKPPKMLQKTLEVQPKMIALDINHFGFSNQETGIYKYQVKGKEEWLVVEKDVTYIKKNSGAVVTIALSKLLEVVKQLSIVIMNKADHDERMNCINKVLINAANSKESNINAYDSLVALTMKYTERMGDALHDNISNSQIDLLHKRCNTYKETWAEYIWRFKHRFLIGGFSACIAKIGLHIFGISNWQVASVFTQASWFIIKKSFILTAPYSYFTVAASCGYLGWRYKGLVQNKIKNFYNKVNASRDQELVKSTCVGKVKPTQTNGNPCRLTDLEGQKIDNDAINKGVMIDCNCEIDGKYRYVEKINPDLPELEKPVLYTPCLANNISSLARMLTKLPLPEEVALTEFRSYVESINFTQYIDQVQVDRNQWFNHLNSKKQEEILEYFNCKDDSLIDHSKCFEQLTDYENFVKSEKQFATGEDAPKTRCICAPKGYVKYICGPIVIELERIFKKQFFGYKTPENWTEMEKQLQHYDDNGFIYTLQLDGSAYDTSQHSILKQIVDQHIYGLLEFKELHTSFNNFQKIINQNERKVTCMVRRNGKNINYGSLTISGQTFSGSMDTTLMNTIRMSLYNRFIHHIAGLDEERDYKLWVKGDDVLTVYNDLDKRNRAMACYNQYFVHKDEVDTVEIKGLGQIAKFYKIGDLTDIDFCSVNVIKTLKGRYKVIRKIENLALKENFSIKSVQYGKTQWHKYNNDMVVSATKWTGGNNLIQKFINIVHKDRNPLLVAIETIKESLRNRVKKGKMKLPVIKENKNYLDRIRSYEEHLLEDCRITATELTDEDIINWVGTKRDNPDYDGMCRAFEFILSVGNTH